MRDPMFGEKLRVLPVAFESQPLSLVVSKSVVPDLEARIVAACKVLQTNGDLLAIFKRYGIAQDLQ